jgi:hypothetical protein
MMKKIHSFNVKANKNIGGKREIERYENGVLTKIVAGKGKRDENVKLSQNSTGKFVRLINGKIQNKEFEVLETFPDVSWTDATPKDRKHAEHISGKTVSVVIIRISNSKVIDKNESVTVSSECSPSAFSIGKAFREQLNKELKSNLSTDFFKIEKI